MADTEFIANVLQDDLASAIKDTITGNETLFDDFVSKSGSNLAVEYGRQHTVYANAPAGRLLIRPLVTQDVEGQGYEGSAFTEFPFSLEFEAKDTRDAQNKLPKINQALRSIFADHGEQMWNNFTDTGSNAIDDNGDLQFAGAIEEEDESGTREFVRIVALVSIRMWHKVPMTAP